MLWLSVVTRPGETRTADFRSFSLPQAQTSDSPNARLARSFAEGRRKRLVPSQPQNNQSTPTRSAADTYTTAIMSWLGVAPLKKFPAPFRTSIAASVTRAVPPPPWCRPPERSRVFLLTAIQTRSEALLALLRCRYVMRKCNPEFDDNRSLGPANQSQNLRVSKCGLGGIAPVMEAKHC